MTFLQAVARPKFRGPRPASIARTQVWLGLPIGRFQSGGTCRIAAAMARWWSSRDDELWAIWPKSRRRSISFAVNCYLCVSFRVWVNTTSALSATRRNPDPNRPTRRGNFLKTGRQGYCRPGRQGQCLPTLFRFVSVQSERLSETRTRGQSNLTKSASRGAHSPVRGHPRGSKVVPLNSCGRVSY